MKTMGAFYIIFPLLLLISAANCSKVLIVTHVLAQSHYNVFRPLIEELSNRNHDVTVQSYFTLKEPRPNVKELKLTQQDAKKHTDMMKLFFRKSLETGPTAQMRAFVPAMKGVCSEYLNDATTKTLLTSGERFDVAIVDGIFGECAIALASVLTDNVIEFFTTSAAFKTTSVPAAPSYIPNPMELMPSKMDFCQRFQNTISFIGSRYLSDFAMKSVFQEAISESLPQAGSLEEIEKKVVFQLTNGDPVMKSPRPSMPNIVDCGGMHCRKAKPLPKDLNDFVESSGDDGFIMFGLGSNMKSEYLSPEELDAILSAFARLKQKVVWKFEAKLDNLPKNVMIVDWMPQQDLLGHPKIRLFITHSGLLSLQETIFHGVPVIGIPLFAEQRGNIMRMKELGIGEHMDFLNLTTDGFHEMIERVLNDKSYYENMKKYSSIFKDQPEKPVDRAVFWIEYVIRHNGARHFRSAGEDLNFFQYYLLDVIGLVLLVATTGLGIVAYLSKLVIKKFCCKKQSKKDLKQKKN